MKMSEEKVIIFLNLILFLIIQSHEIDRHVNP